MTRHPPRLARRPLLGAAAASLAACGPTPGRPDQRADSASGELKDIVIATPIMRTDTMTHDLNRLAVNGPNCNVYERLTQCDEHFQLKPMLAERWELINNGATWRFYLRKGVTFHDGSPFTARDVVSSFDRVARRGGAAINSVEGATVAVDDHTVDFTPSRPNLKVPSRLADLATHAHIIKAGTDSAVHPMGTGPMKFVSYKPDESIEVERYDGYWDTPNAARVRSILLRLIPDGNARILALRAGDVDVIMDVPREAVSELKRESKLRVVQSALGGFNAIYINATGEDEWGLTADRQLRRALAMGINREQIVRDVYEGNAEVSQTLIPATMLGAYKDRVKGPPAYDPAAARRALDELGWRPGPDGIRVKDGRRLEIVIGSGFPSPELQRPIPEVLQSQLRQIGVAAQIVEQSLSNLVVDGQLRAHFWLEAYGAPEPDPIRIVRFFLSPAAGNTGSYARFGPGAGVDEPVMKSDQTTDEARSQELAAEGLKALLEDDVTVIPLAGTYKIWAMSSNVELSLHPAPYMDQIALARKR
ncbi:MAG TPA: ABC transporter substrate-binding protein [Candidatus Limnocylindria bacterium]|nr:ABC transporter substrate-binding protein [Candidatus Limnocylindria bacterium]